MAKEKTRKLSLNETYQCLKAWREYKDEEAITLLINCNTALVKFVAKKYLKTGLTFDELVSAGQLGLFNAINKFDYINEDIFVFSSYIGVSIENAMINELRKYNKHSHVLSFEQPIGQNKDGDDLKIEDLVGTDSDDLIENVIAEMKIDIVKEALQCLTSREKQIILLRYGLDDSHKKTQAEVAKIFECSISTIAKQEQKALIKMRHPKNTRKLKDFIDD